MKESIALPANNEQHRPHFRLKLMVWLLVAVAVVVAGIVFLHKHDATEATLATAGTGTEGTTVTTATAKSGDIGLYLDSIGTVTPVYTASITSQVNGIVTDVQFQEGEVVKKGDPLITIDPRPYEATLLQAQGALERDENLLAQAKMDLDRYQAAWARNAIQKQTLDDQEKLVLQDQGIVKNDQGTVQFDQIQVDFCSIAAPIDGRVGLRLVDPGNVVQANGSTPLAVITQISPITIIFTIPQTSIGLVQSHFQDGAKLEVDALDNLVQKSIASGALLTLDNQIDTVTGTVKARSQFDNAKGALFPNQFVNVRLLVTTYHNATLIPTSTIQHNGDASFVYVIQNNTAHMRSVKPGVSDGDLTQVTGINPGDVIADSGFEKLQDNGKVSPTTMPAAATTAASTESEAP
jgi:multidrug efflux system membrane fusion protein